MIGEYPPAGAYRVVVPGNDASMEPAYEAGDVAGIGPRLKIRPGDDALLRTRDAAPVAYRLLRVVRMTDSQIIGRQYNPPRVVRLSRQKWAAAGRVYERWCRPEPGFFRDAITIGPAAEPANTSEGLQHGESTGRKAARENGAADRGREPGDGQPDNLAGNEGRR